MHGVVHQSNAPTKMTGLECVSMPQLSMVETRDVIVESAIEGRTYPVNQEINVSTRMTSAMVVLQCVRMVLILPCVIQILTMISVLHTIDTLDVPQLMFQQIIRNATEVKVMLTTRGMIVSAAQMKQMMKSYQKK